MKDPLDRQHEHWEGVLAEEPDLFGTEASLPARHAERLFAHAGAHRILELGGGQGRDTLHFARQGLSVTVLDYAPSGLAAIRAKAEAEGLGDRIATVQHDIRLPLPLDSDSFDGCYSHMLFCMALTTAELMRLSGEVWRILRPGGYHLYTVRHTGDAHFGMGTHRGEAIYETGGFAVHFFSREKVTELAEGFRLEEIAEFEEGRLPRRLFRVTLRKPFGAASAADVLSR